MPPVADRLSPIAAMPQARTTPHFRAWGAPPTWIRGRKDHLVAGKNRPLKRKSRQADETGKFSVFRRHNEQRPPPSIKRPEFFQMYAAFHPPPSCPGSGNQNG